MKHRKQRSDKGKPRGSYKENVQTISEPLKEESGDNLVETPEKRKELTYEDIPLSTRNNIEGVIKYRLSIGLPDDSVERKRKALEYYKHSLSLKEE